MTRSSICGCCKVQWQSHFLLWALVLLGFAPSLIGPWLLDDAYIRSGIEAAHSNPFGLLSQADWRRYLFLGDGTGRPLAMASFLVNGMISEQPLGFKLTNVLAHALTASLVLVFLTRVLEVTDTPSPKTLAFVATLVWALHPLHMSTVAYVVQRMAVLASLFSVWSMLSYARLRIEEIDRGRPVPAARYLPSLFFLPLAAVLSKETGVLTPLFLLLLELVLIRPRGSLPFQRFLRVYFLLVVASIAILAIWLFSADSPFSSGYAGRPFNMYERVLSQARVMTLYLFQILLPIPSKMVFFYDAYPPSVDWLTPWSTMVSGLLLCALAVVGFYGAVRLPVAGFGILFFFVGHALESTVLPLELVFEHRNYLPSVGIVLALTLLANVLLSHRWLGRAVASLTVAVMFVLLSARAVLWSHGEGIYVRGLESEWPSARARAEYAQLLTDRGNIVNAHAVLAEGLGVGSRLHEAYLQCLTTGHADRETLKRASIEMRNRLDDYDITSIIRLTNLALDGHCIVPEERFSQLLLKAAQRPLLQVDERQALWIYLAHWRHSSGDISGALAAIERGRLLEPSNPVPPLLAAQWLLASGDRDGAQAALRLSREGLTSAAEEVIEAAAALERALGAESD